jgi:hypothetical protein
VSCEIRRWWADVILTFHQTERQPTGRSHRAPPFELAGDDRSQFNQPVSRAPIGHLDIKVDPRAMVPNLLMDVRVAFGWDEAAKLRKARPRLAERPAQRPGPEARRFLGDIGRYVDEDVQPLSLLSQGTSEDRH